MIKKRKNVINKNLLTIAIISLVSLIAGMLISGCSVFDIVKKAYSDAEEPLPLPEVEIDEGEIKEISEGSENTKKSFIIEKEVSLIDESARNPFKPFYISDDEDEEEENILNLSGVTIKDGVEYAELNFNGYVYNLKENDALSDFYLVQAINNDSVVLLKGDEIITLYIGIPVYD